MIDFTNYTPVPSREALAAPLSAGDIGRSNFSFMMMHLFPGVIDSGLFVIILLAIFIIGAPIILWLIHTGRIKNETNPK